MKGFTSRPIGADELLTQLARARQSNGEGKHKYFRELFHFCGRAFRDYEGKQLAMDRPVLPVRELSLREYREWERLAVELPEVVRAVLQLQRDALQSNRQFKLREVRWEPERLKQLLELHQLVLLLALKNLRKAEAFYLESVSKKAQLTPAQLKCRHGMKVRAENACEKLSKQIQTLENVTKRTA